MPSSLTPSSLKRPRSTSQPPSPSSSSSPKRAASEDPFGSSSDYESARSDLLAPAPGMTHSQLANGSSPLRSDLDGDDESAGEWVKRTGEVKIASSEAGDVDIDAEGEEDGDRTVRHDGQDVWKARYNELLENLPPPFNAYETYYVLPKSTLNTIQLLALGDEEDRPTINFDGEGGEGYPLENAMNNLVPDSSAEKFWVIQSQGEGSETKLIGEGREEQVWALGDKEENVDFVFVSKSGWEKVAEWFGDYEGPELPRYCVPPENIELRPPTLRLFIVLPTEKTSTDNATSNDEAAQIELMCPSTTPMPIFQSFVRSVASLKLGSVVDASWPVRLWTIPKSGENDEKLLTAGALVVAPTTLIATSSEIVSSSDCSDERVSLAESILGSSKSKIIAIEFGKKEAGADIWNVGHNLAGHATEKGPAPLFSKSAFYSGSGSTTTTTTTKNNTGESSASSSGMQTRSQTRQGERRGKGLVGLQNLGNTCFMNSAVQCLSNTQELSEYFLSGVYHDELNRDNPLGMHGQIAEAFGGVIKSLWASNTSSYSSHSPRELKWTTSKFAPQFAGYGQHDTQEFIAFLLDGLHEDLNRIIKKPYIEKPDWKAGGGDRELAELGKECWEGYKKRNDSVIVDLFQGQLQSTLVCPECHKESITMDPFMYLTVPLPVAQHRRIKTVFVPRDPGQAPVKMHLLISQNASFMQIKEKIATLVGAEPSKLLGFDLWKNGVYAWWLDSAHNSEFKDSDEAIFYELDAQVTATHKVVGASSSDGSITVPVYTFKTQDSSRYSYRNNDYPSENAMKPFFITLSRTEASDPKAVREAIWHGYSRFIRPEFKDQIHVPASSSHASAHTTAPPKSEDEDVVTEIHLNGNQATVVDVPSIRNEDDISMDIGSPIPVSHPSPNPSLTPSTGGLHPSASSTSLVSQASTSARSTAGSTSSSLVARADLYKVYVSDPAGDLKTNFFGKDKDKGVAPFYKKDPNSASSSWSLLESRRKKAKKHPLNRLASGISHIVSSGYSSEGEGSDLSAASAQSDATASGSAGPSSPVVRPGEGIFCEWASRDLDEWLDIDVMGDEVIDPAIAKEIAKRKEGKNISIEDCLDEFSKEETLGQDDLWYCPVCKKHQAATKRLEIYKAPDILVICIKRFGSSRRMGDKLDNMVHFPIDGLDLEDRIGERKVAKTLKLDKESAGELGIEAEGESMVYDLYAVDNHFGGMGGGHYTAFCRNRVDGQWYNYDDSRVSRADAASVQSRAAYLLFYRRRTERPIGGISRIKAEEASRAVTPLPEDADNINVARQSTSVNISRSPSPSPAGSTSALPLSSPSSDDLPTYSALSSPRPPSPTLSDDSATLDNGSPAPALASTSPPSIQVEDIASAFPPRASAGAGAGAGGSTLTHVGQSIGFGNTAWGSSASSAAPAPASTQVQSVHHTFGTDTKTDTDTVTVAAAGHHDEQNSNDDEVGEVISPISNLID